MSLLPWFEANQGLFSAIAFVAAIFLAWIEYLRAEGAEANSVRMEITAAQSVIFVFSEVLHLARADGAAGGDFPTIWRKLKFETDRTIELLVNLGSRVTNPGTSVILGDLTSYLRHDASFNFPNAGSPEAARRQLDMESARLGNELRRVADALSALGKAKKLGKPQAIRPFS